LPTSSHRYAQSKACTSNGGGWNTPDFDRLRKVDSVYERTRQFRSYSSRLVSGLIQTVRCVDTGFVDGGAEVAEGEVALPLCGPYVTMTKVARLVTGGR